MASESLDQLVEKVETWSTDKGLDQSNSHAQFSKTIEEIGEVASALSRGQKDLLQDGIGDVVVTLVILAQQNDMTLKECLQMAYDEIKGRTGVMKDGIFIKDE